MGLSRTVSEINGDFSRKSQNVPTPVYFVPRRPGSPWDWVSAYGDKKLEWCGYHMVKKVLRWTCDKRTDRHRTTAKTAEQSIARVKTVKTFRRWHKSSLKACESQQPTTAVTLDFGLLTLDLSVYRASSDQLLHQFWIPHDYSSNSFSPTIQLLWSSDDMRSSFTREHPTVGVFCLLNNFALSLPTSAI